MPRRAKYAEPKRKSGKDRRVRTQDRRLWPRRVTDRPLEQRQGAVQITTRAQDFLDEKIDDERKGGDRRIGKERRSGEERRQRKQK